MPSRRLAIFDFDGTVADSAGWFFSIVEEVAREHGHPGIPPAEREVLRGLPNREIVARLGIPAWRLPKIAAQLRALATRDAHLIRPFPWVGDVFADLAGDGVTLAIVSSNTEANIRTVLGPAIMARVSSIETGAALFGKAAKFRRVLRRTGIAPEAAVAVGDEARDVEAAAEAGIASIAVAWGYATPAGLDRARPTLIVERPEDLAAAIRG